MEALVRYPDVKEAAYEEIQNEFVITKRQKKQLSVALTLLLSMNVAFLFGAATLVILMTKS